MQDYFTKKWPRCSALTLDLLYKKSSMSLNAEHRTWSDLLALPHSGGSITAWPQGQGSIIPNQREEQTRSIMTLPLPPACLSHVVTMEREKSSQVKHVVGTPEKTSPPKYWAAVICTSEVFRHFDPYLAVRIFAEFQAKLNQRLSYKTYNLSPSWGVAVCWLDLLRSFFSGAWCGNANSVQRSNTIKLLVSWRWVITILVSHWMQPSCFPLCMACGQEKLLCLKQELEGSQPW